jgi:sugar O-acyltransferase (sialic acid O-acetyltransferase NeuD family)
MKKIAIFGCGGFGREVLSLGIKKINEQNNFWEFVGFYDENQEIGSIVNEYPVLGGIKEINEVSYSLGVVVAIGDPFIRMKVIHSIHNNNIFFPNIIHPNVIIGDNKFFSIGDGCIIGPGNVLSVNTKIGNFVIIDTLCSIGHDTVIKDYVSIMPGVNVSGEVVVEEAVFIGTGAKIVNRKKVGRETIVGAGAIVSKSLPEKCTAVGIPAKPVKFHDM